MQHDKEYMAVAGLAAGATLLYLHASGTRMIEEGVDGASSKGLKRIISYGAGEGLGGHCTTPESQRLDGYDQFPSLHNTQQQDGSEVRLMDRRTPKQS